MNKSILGNTNTNPIDTDGDLFIIDQEYSSNNKKGQINYISPYQSMKDLINVENCGKKNADFAEGPNSSKIDLLFSDYNTNIYEEQIEKVKATSISPKKSKINSTTKKSTPYTNNETVQSENENEDDNNRKDYPPFTLSNNNQNKEESSKVLFESGIRQHCCSTKGKCIIF